MKKLEALRQILRDAITPELPLDDIVWRGHVLHTHAIALPDGTALDDVNPTTGGGRIVLAALTRNSVAELLASLWPSDEQRGREAYWWSEADRRAPYEVFSDVPEAERARAEAARQAIAGHPLVAELIEE